MKIRLLRDFLATALFLEPVSIAERTESKKNEIPKKTFTEMLSFARRTLVESERGESFDMFCGRVGIKKDSIAVVPSDVIAVDVILWVRGEIRGSWIIEGKDLLESIYTAVTMAKEDIRFKPVTAEEHSYTRIELILMQGLRVPLTKNEREQNEINPKKAYRASFGDTYTWVVPATQNVRIFESLDDLLTFLVREKLELDVRDRENIKKVEFTSCDVVDVIEGVQVGDPACMITGAVMNPHSERTVERAIEETLAFVLRIQERDGSFPLIVSPFGEYRTRVDWVRSAALIHALIHIQSTYPECSNREHIERAISRGYRYLKEYVFSHATMDSEIRCATLIEYATIATYCGETHEAERAHKTVVELIPHLPYKPLLASYIGEHLIHHGTESEKMKAEDIITLVYDDYIKQRHAYELHNTSTRVDLVTFSMLPALLAQSRKGRQHEGDEVAEWLLSFQNEDGSFPQYPLSLYAYTRGMGKMLEALTPHYLTTEDVRWKRGMEWLMSMQYTKENSYFVRESQRERILGAFRHDHHNALAWIDSTAHFIRAAKP